VLPDHLAPGLRVVIAGTRRAGRALEPDHFYAGPGNKFWVLLHASGLVPRLLDPDEDAQVTEFGVGLTDLLSVVDERAGQEPVVTWQLDEFVAKIVRSAPLAVAFVSKTAAARYARAAGERAPKNYGALSWTVGGVPAFVLPGPSGANNGMPLPLRTALWHDLADFLETL
jgi:TDG/mug DNA glycosylase family protein